MDISLNPDTRRMIDDHIRRGEYVSADDLLQAALASLAQKERDDEFEPGEWDRLIEEGERSGPPLGGEQILAELRESGDRKLSKAGCEPFDLRG